VVRVFKSITAREVFRRKPGVKKELWGREFWTDGYDGHDDLLVHQYRPRVSKRLPHDLAVQRCTLALLGDADDFAPARVLYHQQMERMAEQIAIAEARLQRLTRTMTDHQRAVRAYVAELSGALIASDERALLERHRASIAHRADEIGIYALTAEAYPEDALSDELSSHRQTKLETNKIKFPDVLITYRDEDILAVEVERTRSATKRGSMKLVDLLLTTLDRLRRAAGTACDTRAPPVST